MTPNPHISRDALAEAYRRRVDECVRLRAALRQIADGVPASHARRIALAALEGRTL